MQCDDRAGFNWIKILSFRRPCTSRADTRPHDCGRLYVLHVYLFVNQLNCGLVKNEFQPTNSWLLCLVINNKPAPIADVLVIWLTFHWWKWRRHTARAYDHRREPIVTIVLAFALSRSRSYSRRVRIRAMLIAIKISKLRNAIADCNLQGQRLPYVYLILRCESRGPSFRASNKR